MPGVTFLVQLRTWFLAWLKQRTLSRTPSAEHKNHNEHSMPHALGVHITLHDAFSCGFRKPAKVRLSPSRQDSGNPTDHISKHRRITCQASATSTRASSQRPAAAAAERPRPRSEASACKLRWLTICVMQQTTGCKFFQAVDTVHNHCKVSRSRGLRHILRAAQQVAEGIWKRIGNGEHGVFSAIYTHGCSCLHLHDGDACFKTKAAPSARV